MITSKNNQQLKKIRQLMESSKERKKLGMFVIEGTRLVGEAPAELIDSVYISDEYLKNGGAVPEGTSAETVADDIFRSLSDTVNPQGILAVVRQPSYGLEKVIGSDMFILLDDIRDPGNLGTIVRTAEAAGAGVIMSEGCADIFNPKVIRSTMGTIFRVPFAICSMTEAVQVLKEKGVTVCAAVLDGSIPYGDLKVQGPVAFVIGNEANGVSQKVCDACQMRVRIPMRGHVESLNAAVSAAILMYGRY